MRYTNKPTTRDESVNKHSRFAKPLLHPFQLGSGVGPPVSLDLVKPSIKQIDFLVQNHNFVFICVQFQNPERFLKERKISNPLTRSFSS